MDPSFTAVENKVLELPGLYGPFTFPERLFQKIWVKGTFDDRGLVSTCGRKISIVQRGKWNLLGGPDFKQARIRFDDGQEIIGDIELHLDARDWAATNTPSILHTIVSSCTLYFSRRLRIT